MLSYLFTLLPFTSMAQRVIDVHSHIITPEFLSTLREEGRLLDEGFPLPKYSVDTHLQWMDAAGVTTSVLTQSGSFSVQHCLCPMSKPPSTRHNMPSTY